MEIIVIDILFRKAFSRAAELHQVTQSCDIPHGYENNERKKGRYNGLCCLSNAITMTIAST
jgi:hypothetical protein